MRIPSKGLDGVYVVVGSKLCAFGVCRVCVGESGVRGESSPFSTWKRRSSNEVVHSGLLDRIFGLWTHPLLVHEAGVGSLAWTFLLQGNTFVLAALHLRTLLLLYVLGVILTGGQGYLAIHSSWCHLMVGCQGTGLGCGLGKGLRMDPSLLGVNILGPK